MCNESAGALGLSHESERQESTQSSWRKKEQIDTLACWIGLGDTCPMRGPTIEEHSCTV